MGLKERRALKDFQESKYPALQTQIQEAVGFPIEVEVEWSGLVEDERDFLQASQFADNWEQVFFHPTIAAFKEVASDDMGKEALQESIKRVVFKNSNDSFNDDHWASLSEGVLVLDHSPSRNMHASNIRKMSLQTLLEKSM